MSLDRPQPGESLVESFQRLIDRNFNRTAGRTLQEIAAVSQSGLIRQRLDELSKEAIRLAEAGERLQLNSPILRALQADLENALAANATIIRSAGIELQTGMIVDAGTITRQLALPGFTDEMLEGIGVRWNVPDPEAVNQLVGFIDNPAWADELSGYGERVLETVNKRALLGIVRGENAVSVAEDVVMILEGRAGVAGLPLSQAENLLRTLQLQSYRTAAAINQAANAAILEKIIRVAALDERTCLACITLHGTELAVGERVDDHHRGRCVGVPVVRGTDRQVDQTGEQWFFSQSEAQQLWIAGHANFGAIQAGEVSLNPAADVTFVQPYTDPVFGNMLREASLVGTLGKQAQEFYLHG
jgi:hypothetical protein